MPPLASSSLDAFDRISGVYVRGSHTPTDSRTFAEEVSQRVRAITNAEPVGALLQPAPPAEPQAYILCRASPGAEQPIRDLTSWLRGIDAAPRILSVPARLRMWLPVRVVVAVPVRSPVWRIGALFASGSGLSRATISALEGLATDVALELEADSRAETLATLRRMAARY